MRRATAALLAPAILAFAGGAFAGGRLERTSIPAPQPTPHAQRASLSDAEAPTTVVVGASTGDGLSYLPLLVMRERKLLEKHAAALGLRASLDFRRYPKPQPMYNDLLSGRLSFAAGGVTQLSTSWDRTRNGARIKGVAALNSMPLDLITNNPRIRSLADFTPRDRIALPAVRTSIEAVVLEMAARKAFGSGRGDRLDPLTIAMGHPAAVRAMLSGRTAIDAHVASAPYMIEELARPGTYEVFDSYAVVGGPHTHNVLWATTKFHDDNAKLYTAFVGALSEALQQIRTDPTSAAALYRRAAKVTELSEAQLIANIRDPQSEWTLTPKKFILSAHVMKGKGLISAEPSNWRSLFFDNVRGLPGS